MNVPPSHGHSHPLGATVIDGGVNVSLFSRFATGVELLLFDQQDGRPLRVIPIDPVQGRSYHYWHVFGHYRAASRSVVLLYTSSK